jgi:octaprenyl-diphosphate synthase
VELIHNATLLHDDVIDIADYRRGKPAARVVYGNAASILSGDWLLIQALKRVRRTAMPGILERTLSTIEEIIAAETLQLAQRGKLDTDRAAYFRVIQGKTAALFRLSMSCGAKAGGVSEDQCRVFERYGAHLGIAFQLVDDLLDFTADAHATGKALLTDLREGKMTYPLLLSLERDRTLRSTLERILVEPSGTEAWGRLAARVLEIMHSRGGLRDCLALARERAGDAIECLRTIPESPGRAALIDVAEAVVDREH